MIRVPAFILLLLFPLLAIGQSDVSVKVSDEHSGERIGSAYVRLGNFTSVTDSSGTAWFRNLPDGRYELEISHVGFETLKGTLQVRKNISTSFEYRLAPGEEEEEEVVIRSTRTSRTIQNVPTRVETISLEEVDEKINMRPANVSMLLHESTGIQVQQTSATSGNAGIRIQGLDGRYTQLLKDGFAGFGNFASGLSVLEIPPLDLQQVEIIKGPASPLFGGGAIAGVVNFISKTPKEKAENYFLLNASHIGQQNLGYFSSKRGKKAGYTLLALVNNQRLYDVDRDDFTELPESIDFTVHPKLFIYPGEHSKLVFGNSFSYGDRKGGDVQVIRGRPDLFHQYYEENETIRNLATLEYEGRLGSGKTLVAKQGLTIYDRHIEIPGYHLDGISSNSFTDISILSDREKHSLVTGATVVYDVFNENDNSDQDRDNKNLTMGVYIQDTWDASEKIKLESGLRLDWAKYYNPIYSNSEFFALPRISLLVKYNEKLSSRIGIGMGYKLPSLFTEDAESLHYRDILQLDTVVAERSYGGTADVNLRTRIGDELELSVNQMFFYTWISKPLVLQGNGSPDYWFRNEDEPVVSRGFETNIKFIYHHDYKLFLGYTFTDAEAKYLPGEKHLPLVPKHKFNSALIYEKHGFLKVGLEAYFTGPQYLRNGTRTESYWDLGFMTEKTFGKFSLFLNLENFLDTRQSKFKRVVNEPHATPVFDDIWTHTEGFVLNGGIKLRL
jgi:iron complex outermembrane receptor protein/outer membrane receptor for ferrienterochelin and colicins